MSHFTVMVRASAALVAEKGSVEDAVESLLRPYQENNTDDCPEQYLEFHEDEDCSLDEKTSKHGYWENRNAKWDWYSIGGRWSGFFPLKAGRIATLGQPGAFGNQPDANTADIVRPGDIDFDAVGDTTNRQAAEFWDEWQRFIAGEKFGAFDGPRQRAMSLGLLDVKTEALTADEATRAISWSEMVAPNDDRASWHDVYRVISKEEFFRDYLTCFNPLKTYAVLDASGWNAPGDMGWFGCSSDKPETYLEFANGFAEWMRASNSDDWLVVVDCHI